ncbi:MAG: sugar phosphate isomerase/epimerase [Verrucomicrobia bacterium]|nr:sugar phosphate isomerase/epimerase [Verrucomicrobiota bacterium]MBI3870279.1 sugar phosphate isomerase/epimerase [Verrucomicrobiota bacterium]
MKLKLACADFTFPLLAHDQTLDLIRMLEFEGVDIGLFEERSHLWPSKELRSPSASGKRLKQRLDDRGLRCADVFLQLAPSFVPYAVNHPEAARRRAARDRFLRTLEYAAASGSAHVTTLPGVEFENEKPGQSWERCRAELAWRVEQARKHGLIFGVEAHVGSIVPRPRKALRLVREVPGLTLTLDYTHFTRSGLPDETVEPLVRHASHFHARGARMSCKINYESKSRWNWLTQVLVCLTERRSSSGSEASLPRPNATRR